MTRAYLHFLRPNELVEMDLSPLELNAAREHVRSFISGARIARISAQSGRPLFPL